MKKLFYVLFLSMLCLIGFISCSQKINKVVFPDWLIGSWDYGSSYSIIENGTGVKKGIIVAKGSVKMAGSTVYDDSDSLYTDNYKVSVSDNEVVIEANSDSTIFHKFTNDGRGKVVLKISNGYIVSTYYMKNEYAHEHVYSTEWTSNSIYHWHEAICGHSVINDKGEHIFDGDICTVCGYNKHKHSFSSSWTSDDTSHWHEATCGHDVKNKEAKHSFGPDIVTDEPTCISTGSGYHTCTVCGKTVTYSIPEEPNNHSFNSDGVCTNCYLHDATCLYVFYDKGSYSDGWRYLEAAPADLRGFDGVVTVDKGQIYSKRYGYYVSGYDDHYYGYKIQGGKYMFVNGTKTYNSTDCTGTAIGTGETNTRLLIDSIGDEPYNAASNYTSIATIDSGDYAARLCDRLTYTVKGVTYDDWFLPSIGELEQLFLQRDKIGGFSLGSYWSSSEDSSKSSAKYILVINMYKSWGDEYEIARRSMERTETCRIRPIRAF